MYTEHCTRNTVDCRVSPAGLPVLPQLLYGQSGQGRQGSSRGPETWDIGTLYTLHCTMYTVHSGSAPKPRVTPHVEVCAFLQEEAELRSSQPYCILSISYKTGYMAFIVVYQHITQSSLEGLAWQQSVTVCPARV